MILKLLVGDDNAMLGMHTPDGFQRFSVFDFHTIAYLFRKREQIRTRKMLLAVPESTFRVRLPKIQNIVMRFCQM